MSLAIDLKSLEDLIGIYGAPADVRALVRIRAELERLRNSNLALSESVERSECRLREVTKAGTPYWAERDAQNALILENERLRAEREDLRRRLEAAGEVLRITDPCRLSCARAVEGGG